MVRSAGSGMRYQVDADALRDAARAMQERVDEKADMRAKTAWASVDEIQCDAVASVIEELNESYRASWADLKDHLDGLAETSRAAAEVYEATDRQVTDETTALFYF